MRIQSRDCATYAAMCLLMNLGGFSLGARAEVSGRTTCKLAFDVTAEVAHGTVSPGDRLHGSIEFSTGEMWQENEARSFRTRGKMVLSHPDHGTVSGAVWVVHVSRTPHFVDYISIDARNAGGDLGGIEQYFDPMLVTVYTNGGALTSFELPKQSREWNALNKKRTFQVHTPTATQTFYGVTGPIDGQCLTNGR